MTETKQLDPQVWEVTAKTETMTQESEKFTYELTVTEKDGKKNDYQMRVSKLLKDNEEASGNSLVGVLSYQTYSSQFYPEVSIVLSIDLNKESRDEIIDTFYTYIHQI